MPEQNSEKNGQSMAYKLNVTEYADELLDNLVYHLIYRLKNKQAAKHLLNRIDVIYDRLEVNPFQVAECRDTYLARKGYREAVVSQMNYIIVFDVRAESAERLALILGPFRISWKRNWMTNNITDWKKLRRPD